MAGRIVYAPERALQNAKEARRFVAMVILRSSGERRVQVNRIAAILDTAIAELGKLVASERR